MKVVKVDGMEINLLFDASNEFRFSSLLIDDGSDTRLLNLIFSRLRLRIRSVILEMSVSWFEDRVSDLSRMRFLNDGGRVTSKL